MYDSASFNVSSHGMAAFCLPPSSRRRHLRLARPPTSPQHQMPSGDLLTVMGTLRLLSTTCCYRIPQATLHLDISFSWLTTRWLGGFFLMLSFLNAVLVSDWCFDCPLLPSLHLPCPRLARHHALSLAVFAHVLVYSVPASLRAVGSVSTIAGAF